ncbi:hypothetical protein lerEdw1_019771 [Lerista edwardsae]|nr:hypothetical protein lerEdw1_019771 [Lerista edwardsae]
MGNVVVGGRWFPVAMLPQRPGLAGMLRCTWLAWARAGPEEGDTEAAAGAGEGLGEKSKFGSIEFAFQRKSLRGFTPARLLDFPLRRRLWSCRVITAMEQQNSLMRKGFEELKEMEGHKHRKTSLWNPPSTTRGSPSRASQAVNKFYEQQAERRSADALALGFVPELTELQKCFLTRPGCPKYSNRATSTTQIEPSSAKMAKLPSNISTISLSSQVPMDDLNALIQAPEGMDSQSSLKYFPASISQSVPGFLQSYSEDMWAPGGPRSRAGSKIPWYITVLREKDVLLQKLGGEVSRLARCETECARKDDVISILREEVQGMQEQLDDLKRGPGSIPKQEGSPETQETPETEQSPVLEESPVKEEPPPEPPAEPKPASVRLPPRGVSLPAFFPQKTIPKELREEMERLKAELTRSDKVLDTKMVQLSHTLMKDQEELEELEKEYREMQQKSMLRIGEEEEMLPEESSKELIIGGTEVEEEQSRDKSIHGMLFEFQRINQDLYEELEKVKEDYDIATGTVLKGRRKRRHPGQGGLMTPAPVATSRGIKEKKIFTFLDGAKNFCSPRWPPQHLPACFFLGAISSLQRQLSFEESQLRNAHSEQNLLRKELRERGNQLEAMSTKFSNLREERKHEEMMGAIERENHKLRQDVADLEIKLSEKSQLIEDLQTQVNRLEAELVLNQHHIGKQLTQQNDLQRQLDTLQRAEQLTRVTLEVIGARFERFRSKIIQATYSSPGTKSPQAEIGDDEVLEALQKIITDRVEYHQLLRQKGVKVPPLNSSEPIILPTHKKKSSSKQGLGTP